MNTDAESALRAANDDWLAAIRAKDVERILRHYAPDVQTFNIAPPLHYAGKEATRRNTERWLGSYKEIIAYEQHDLKLHVSGYVAFLHCLSYTHGILQSGQETEMWFRVTVGLRLMGGEWLVAHEHISEPIDMTNGKGMFDLKP